MGGKPVPPAATRPFLGGALSAMRGFALQPVYRRAGLALAPHRIHRDRHQIGDADRPSVMVGAMVVLVMQSPALRIGARPIATRLKAERAPS